MQTPRTSEEKFKKRKTIKEFAIKKEIHGREILQEI